MAEQLIDSKLGIIKQTELVTKRAVNDVRPLLVFSLAESSVSSLGYLHIFPERKKRKKHIKIPLRYEDASIAKTV